MKKIISGILLLVFIASSHTVFATESTTPSADSCVKFTDSLYMAKDTWLRTAAGYSHRDDLQSDSDIATKQVKRLHVLLEREGFTVANKEKKDTQFGRSTAIAVAGLQNKYKTELLTSQGLTLPYGVLDEKGVEFLNQKYGCIEKSKIKLIDEGKTIERSAGAAITTAYVVSGIPASTKLILSYTNSSGTEVKVEKSSVKNGKGEIVWTTPTAIGTYNIKVKLDGSNDKSEFTLKVISVFEKSFSIISPASDFTSVLPGKNVFVRIAGTFANSEKEGATIVEIQNTTTNKKTVISTSKKISDLLTGANIKIPTDIAGGVYKVLVTYSTTFGSFTKESTTFSIVGAAANAPAPAPTTPTVTVTSPNGGEVWSKSTASRTVTWSTTNLTSSSNTVITAVPTDDPINPYVLSNTTNSGSKTVSISTLPAGTYKIRVTVGSLTQDLSNATFTVTEASSSPAPTPAPTTPTVTVTSPNGGEVWSKSTASRTVTWSTTNLTSSSNTVITAVPTDDPINPYVLSNTTNSGSKTVSISTLPAGTYKIRVTVGSLTQDLSNATFTVTSN